MPDNQQRAKAAGEKPAPETPSTGRRGSHRHADAPSASPRSARKQKSLNSSPTPVEQGGD
jgi:hypothetical protein